MVNEIWATKDLQRLPSFAANSPIASVQHMQSTLAMERMHRNLMNTNRAIRLAMQ